MPDQHDGVFRDRKLVPFPRSISPEAVAALRRLVDEDGIPLNSQ